MYKVLVVTEEGRGGGALGRIRMIAEELNDKIETVVVAPSSAAVYIKSLEDKGIRVIPIAMNPLNTIPKWFIRYVISFIPEIWGIIGIIKREKPHVVHCNGSWQIKGIIAAKWTGTKCIWQMNDTYQPKAVLFFFKMLSGLPDAYFYASHATKAYYTKVSQRLIKKVSKIIQAPVKRKEQIVVREHQLENSPLRLVLVGYINHHKGLDILMNALHKIDERQVVCDVVGPVLSTRAKYKKGLDKLAAKTGVVLNFLGYQDVNSALFDGYDFYVCSSRREASPMAVWEAMTNGLPIISTPVGDIAEIVGKNHCGLVAKDISSEALSAVISEAIMVDQKTYDFWSVNCIKTAALFDHQNIAEQYLEAYTEIIRA